VANQNDVRRIAMSLAGTSREKDRFAFSVWKGDKQKGFVSLAGARGSEEGPHPGRCVAPRAIVEDFEKRRNAPNRKPARSRRSAR
jgi:hypothetical protein